jgi:biopolymer transport protein ExbD
MNFRKRIKVHDEAHFDLTAMIDITLLLLTFFVMGSQFAQAMRKPMDLPRQPGEPGRADSERSLVVDLLADGTVRYAGAESASVAQLAAAVAVDAKRPGGLELTVRVERTAPARVLNQLALELARAGVTRWTLATSGDAGTPDPQVGGGR